MGAARRSATARTIVVCAELESDAAWRDREQANLPASSVCVIDTVKVGAAHNKSRPSTEAHVAPLFKNCSRAIVQHACR